MTRPSDRLTTIASGVRSKNVKPAGRDLRAGSYGIARGGEAVFRKKTADRKPSVDCEKTARSAGGRDS